MQLYQWLSNVASDRGSGKALVYRDTYLSWRGLLHRVDRRAQELHAMGIGPGAWVGLMLGNAPAPTVVGKLADRTNLPVALMSAVVAFGLSGILFCVVARRQRVSASTSGP